MNIKVKYDKALNKYHISYDRVKDKNSFRYNIYKEINDHHSMMIIIETHLGSVHNPDPTDYTKKLEHALTSNNIPYTIKPLEIRVKKSFLGIFSLKKKPIQDFSIIFHFKKGILSQQLFQDIFCEFDLQVGYDLQKDKDDIFTDIEKGYLKPQTANEYYGESFYDSRLFNKFLATTNIAEA